MGLSVSQEKLHPPELPQGYISRPHLLTKLEKGQAKKLTFIVAGAGYGKSTLLAEWVQSKTGCVWYSLDAPDRDPGIFFAHLLAGLQKKWPDFGQDIQTLLNRPSPPDPERLMMALLGEMETAVANPVGQRLLLLFDDYHRLGDAPNITAAMKLLLERLPPVIHVVISSRSPLDFTVRLGLDGQINKLTNQDLRLKNDEVLQILHGLNTDTNAAQKILHQTEGWAAGVQLLRQALQNPHSLDLESSFGAANDSLDDIYAYLAEETFTQHSPELQQFLLQTAILDSFSPEDCDAIFERNDSAHWLDYLIRQNSFTIHLQHDPDIYRHHHLFTNYLRQKLKVEKEANKINNWYLQTATYYLQHQRWLEAFEYAMQGGAEAIATDVMRQAFSKMRLSGQLDTLQEWLERFSTEAYNEYPYLHGFQGLIWVDYGFYDQAKAAFRMGLAAAGAKQDRRGLVSIWSGIGWLNQRIGNFEQALHAWEQALDHAQSGGFHQEQFTTLNGLATVYGLLGQNIETCKLLHQALEKATFLGKAWEAVVMNNLGASLTYLGEFDEALQWCERSFELRKSANLQPGLAHCLNNIGHALYFSGRIEEAGAKLDEAYILAKETNNQFLFSYVLSNMGDVAADQNNFQQANKFYRQSIQLKEPLQDNLGLTHTWTRLSELYRKHHHLAEALKYAKVAVDLSDKVGLNEKLAGKTALVLSQLEKSPSEVISDQLLAIIDAHQNTTNNKYELTRCLWYMAYVKFRIDQNWQKPFAEAISIADQYNYLGCCEFSGCQKYQNRVSVTQHKSQ